VGGQAGRTHGIVARISRFNPELRPALRKNGFLTRDSRMKERKKYGQKGARKRFSSRSASFCGPGPVGGHTELQQVDASLAAEITAGKEPARGCSVATRVTTANKLSY